MSASNHTMSEPRAFNAKLYSFQFFVWYFRVDQLDSLILRAYYCSRLDLCNKATESVKRAIEQTGQEATYMSAQQLSQFQNEELVRWGEIIQSAGIEPE